MDRWNRLIVLLVALLLVVGAVVTVLVATESVDPDFLPGGTEPRSSDSWFYAELDGLRDLDGTDKTIALVVSVAVGLSMLGLLYVEFDRAMGSRDLLLPISFTDDGMLTIARSSVQLLAERTGATNRHITSLRCRVGVRRRPTTGEPATITIECYPRVDLGSDVQEVRDDLQARVKDAVQRLTGLIVLRVDVMRVRYDRGDTARLLGS